MDIKKTILTNLRSNTGSYGLSTIFFDWVELMAYAIANASDKTDFSERENAYLTIVRKYSKEQLSCFSESFAALILALESEKRDWLGEIYMDLGIANRTTGQCFTPSHVARLMAELTLSNHDTAFSSDGCIHYFEPCCGSGSLVIGLASAMERNGHNYQTELKVHCEDLDRHCLMMAYIQLSLLGIQAVCQVKNSLSQDVYSTWLTPFFVLHNCSPFQAQ